MMVVAVFGQASGVAFFPFLSAMAVEQRFGEMTTLLNSVLSRIALYLLPAVRIHDRPVPQIIAMLFQHGNFGAASTAATAPVLSVYLIGAFSFSAVMIISRSFYAVQNTFLPMVISTICALLSIPLYQVFSRLMGASRYRPRGHAGHDPSVRDALPRLVPPIRGKPIEPAVPSNLGSLIDHRRGRGGLLLGHQGVSDRYRTPLRTRRKQRNGDRGLLGSLAGSGLLSLRSGGPAERQGFGQRALEETGILIV